jgi:hypothetical protein
VQSRSTPAYLVSPSLFAVRSKKASSIREFYSNRPMPAIERTVKAVCGISPSTEPPAMPD